MECPDCNITLDEPNTGAYQVATCERCSRVWISGEELARIVSHETDFNNLADIKPLQENVSIPAKSRNCPVCEASKMKVKKINGVEMDVCKQCNGIYFQKDELLELFPRGLGYGRATDNIAMGTVDVVVQALIALLKGIDQGPISN